MRQKDISVKFLAIYNEIDHYMRNVLNSLEYTDHSVLLREMSDKNRLFSQYYKDLKLFSNLRNLLIHNPYPDSANPLIMPHDYIVKKYEAIRSAILYPKKALDIAIRRERIYTTSYDVNALDVMKTMDDKTFTHVPVMNKEEMIGVFSENTVLTYLVHHKDSLILKDTKIEEFKDFIGLDKHRSECFEFMNRNALVIDVELLFQKRLKERKRVAVVYITEHGKQDEKLLGMITAWDIAGRE